MRIPFAMYDGEKMFLVESGIVAFKVDANVFKDIINTPTHLIRRHAFTADAKRLG